VRTEPGFVPASEVTAANVLGLESITSAHDGLFTSAGLGRYSQSLQELEKFQNKDAALVK